MKKILFVQLLAAAAFMTSCSSSDDVVADNGNVANNAEEELVPIHLGIANNNSVEVRGTGTVGSTDGSTGWKGQLIRVTAFKKGTFDYAQWRVKDTDPWTNIFENAEFQTPTTPTATSGIFTGAEATEARPTDNVIRYYPTTQAIDFFGYRIDDATAYDGSATAPALSDADGDGNNDTYSVQFKINGTQDIMLAEVSPVNPDGTAVDAAALATANLTDANLYSARSARKDIHPNLNFNHLLTRMTFAINPSTDEACAAGTGVQITKVEITSFDKGILTIKGAQPGIVWEPETDANGAIFTNFTLTENAADEATNQTVNATLDMSDHSLVAYAKGTAYDLGEAIMVTPSAAFNNNHKYLVTVSMKQKVQKNWDTPIDPAVPATYIEKESKVQAVVTLDKDGNPGNDEFLAGNSYKITISVAGLNAIRVFTTVTNWVTDANHNAEFDPENIDAQVPGADEFNGIEIE